MTDLEKRAEEYAKNRGTYDKHREEIYEAYIAGAKDLEYGLMINLKNTPIVNALKDSIIRNERLSSQEQQELCAWIECAMDFGEQLKKSKGQWHFVKDELPKREGDYLIYTKAFGIEIVKYHSDTKGFTARITDMVIAWRPLPSFPTER